MVEHKFYYILWWLRVGGGCVWEGIGVRVGRSEREGKGVGWGGLCGRRGERNYDKIKFETICKLLFV